MFKVEIDLPSGVVFWLLKRCQRDPDLTFNQHLVECLWEKLKAEGLAPSVPVPKD